MKICPICAVDGFVHFSTVQSFDYFECRACEAIFIDPLVLSEVDEGRSLIQYAEDYWSFELSSSRARCFGSSLARVAEAFLYARRPISTFLDIGAGPGYLLDACATYLPSSADRFYGVEKFPPKGQTADRPNLIIGDVSDLKFRVDAGCCIEVIEHLTPKMLDELLKQLSIVSNENALFVFNSGQPSFVKNEDPRYLDPRGRGHLVSYSVNSMAHLARRHGFRVHALPGKTWAMVLEKTDTEVVENIQDRIWAPVSSNAAALNDPIMGSVMYILGLESARAYG